MSFITQAYGALIVILDLAKKSFALRVLFGFKPDSHISNPRKKSLPFVNFPIWKIPKILDLWYSKNFRFEKFEKCLICEIPKICSLENSKKFQYVNFKKFAIRKFWKYAIWKIRKIVNLSKIKKKTNNSNF